jgi:hypothetical protein
MEIFTACITLCFKGQPLQTLCERNAEFILMVRHVLHSLPLGFKVLSRNLNKLDPVPVLGTSSLSQSLLRVMSCDHAVSGEQSNPIRPLSSSLLNNKSLVTNNMPTLKLLFQEFNHLLNPKFHSTTFIWPVILKQVDLKL